MADKLVGIKLIHPKLWSGDATGRTSEWADFPWLQIKSPDDGSTMINPDGVWTNVQGLTIAPFGWTPVVSATVFIPRYVAADRLVPIVAHEVGHATRTSFYRESFGGPRVLGMGDPEDHTPPSYGIGLMRAIDGTDSMFSRREVKILKGFLVQQ